MRQLALPFAHAPRFRAEDFIAAPSNAEARAWLDRRTSWPGGRGSQSRLGFEESPDFTEQGDC